MGYVQTLWQNSTENKSDGLSQEAKDACEEATTFKIMMSKQRTALEISPV
jgi:hypothetical protein